MESIKSLTRKFLAIHPLYWPTPNRLMVRHRLSGCRGYLTNNQPPLSVHVTCGSRSEIQRFKSIEAFLESWAVASR